ncbi:hypothetical protein CLCR_02811 [Cladophialophora carrionii]|uniref:Clr5 domain-containing protein n=1 Tax=Cladophialophora carrionii TaxID=86049 RepID=A0A1C1D2Q2_9EURO|nr:hypothetical protein CLCR_02811 [Cladophialophora carrionii]
MQSVRVAQRADPFIQQDPNNPRYSRRLSKERWDILKPDVSKLFHRAVSTADILRHLQAHFDVHITRSQLETQMRKWELIAKNESTHYAANPPPGPSVSSEGILQPTPQESSLTSKHSFPIPASNGETPCTAAIRLEPYLTYPRLRLPVYEPSKIVQRVWDSAWSNQTGWYRSAASQRSLEILPDIARTALFLTDLKCFGQVFELWYLITSRINSAVQSDQLWGPQLMFVATICARSAWTDEQVLIASSLLEQLCSWRRDRCLDLDRDRDLSPFTSLTAEIPSLLHLAETLLVMLSAWAHPCYWSTTHYSTSALLAGQIDDEDFRACVGVSAGGLLTKDLRDWPREILNSLLASPDVWRLITEALTEMEDRRRLKFVIDDLVEKPWPPDESAFAGLAQSLACLISERQQENHYGPFPVPWSDILTCSSTRLELVSYSELLDRVSGQAMGVLPFALLTWVRKQMTGPMFAAPNSLSDKFQYAVKELRSLHGFSRRFGMTKLSGFIDVYMEQLHSRPKIDSSLSITPSDRLVRAAAARAGILVSQDDEIPEWSVLASNRRARRIPYSDEQVTTWPEAPVQPEEQVWISNSLLGPPIARSYTSSMSSAFRSFKGLSKRGQSHDALSHVSGLTSSTGRWSEHMDWSSGSVTGLISNPSLRKSSITDVSMDDVEEEGWEDDMD